MPSTPTNHPRRIVVKVGSSIIAPEGTLDETTITRLAAELAELTRTGAQVILVSSGAVAAGFRALGLPTMPTTIVAKQAAAAIGQQRLMHRYAVALQREDLPVAQILLTADDLHHRARFLNARHTVETLLVAGVLPIVNENDTVSFDEIKLGDNDHLSALVANLIDADLLMLLTAAPGVCEGGADGDVIPTIEDADAALVHADGVTTATGVGGMHTKIRAAALAARSGRCAIVADGRRPGLLARLVKGEHIGTLFPAAADAADARKRWIGFSSRPRGTITIDPGAVAALQRGGASLLPSGITNVTGSFDAGDTVEIASPDARTIARGIASYAAAEIDRIKGLRSAQIEATLGYIICDEVIHRDDLVLTERTPA